MRRLKEREVVELDEALQAVMVPNVLVVLCVEQATEQDVNVSSLYQ